MPAADKNSRGAPSAAPPIKTTKQPFMLLDEQVYLEIVRLKLAVAGIAQLTFSGRIADVGSTDATNEELQAVFNLIEDRLQSVVDSDMDTIMVDVPVWPSPAAAAGD